MSSFGGILKNELSQCVSAIVSPRTRNAQRGPKIWALRSMLNNGAKLERRHRRHLLRFVRKHGTYRMFCSQIAEVLQGCGVPLSAMTSSTSTIPKTDPVRPMYDYRRVICRRRAAP